MINLLELNKNSMLKEGNPVLRQKSKDVEFPLSTSNKTLIFKMQKYIMDSNNDDIAEEKNLEPAIGVAAIQVGVLQNIFVMADVDEEQVVTVINPKITKKSKEEIYIESGEGCLSVPNKKNGYVYRSKKIDVEFFDMKGKKVKKTYEGMQAIIFQHEYDHLLGKLYVDYIDDDNPFLEKEGADVI